MQLRRMGIEKAVVYLVAGFFLGQTLSQIVGKIF